MRRFFLVGWAVLGFVAAIAAQERFSQRLSLEERRAAGLDTLTPEQLAALDAFVARERTGAAPAARPTVEAAASAKVQPAPPAARTELTEEQKVSRFALPVTDEPKLIQSRIVGEYRGWTGSTFFQLENGQLWIQDDPNDTHWAKPQKSPAVKIEKSMWGGYKLTVEGERLWVRVKRVR